MVGAASPVPLQASRTASRIDLMPDFSRPIVLATGLSKVVQLNESAANGAPGANELAILQDISLEVMLGEAVAIVGASGSGKSTLLGLLAGLDTPSSGRVQLDGADLFGLDEDGRAALRARLLGFVFQSFQLLPALNAPENPARRRPDRRRGLSVLRLALRMLLRDWRAGELRVLALALVLAVGGVASVAFFADRVRQALTREAHQVLGADMLMTADHAWNPEFRDEIIRLGLARAESVTFVSMARAGKEALLTAVKAVTPGYPLRGKLRIAPGLNAADAEIDAVPPRGTVWPD